MKAIVYKTETGIAIIHPTKEFYLKALLKVNIEKDLKLKYDDQSYLVYEFIAKKDVPEDCEYKIVNESEIPVDRAFREAWGYDLKEKISVVREIKKNMLRTDREPLFVANDLVLRDANIENDSVKLSAGIAERDRLRDITKLIDPCKTISEIKAITV